MARDLNVWMNGELVGTWSQPRGATHVFRYAPAWPDSQRSRALSLSIPITSDLTVKGSVVESYFENLLPDNEAIRKRIQGRFKTSSLEAIELLTAIGRDCVGAAQLLPIGVEPEDVETIKAEPINEARIAQVLRDVVLPPNLLAGADRGEFRISIAGAQEKSALLRHDGKWCLPQGATPTTHIFKLPLGIIGGRELDMRHSIENEWLCLKILDAVGLPVAAASMDTFEDQRALIVERFDREPIGGTRRRPQWIARLPQEDFCQAMGLPPSRKYEADGGPGIDSCINLLNGSATSAPDKSVFMVSQLMFWMLAATDGHGKNFSIFLNPRNRYVMTPLYDVLSVWPLIGKGKGRIAIQDAQLAMALRGRSAHRRIREIHARHWRAFVDKVTPGEWGGFVSFVEETIPQSLERVLSELPKGFPEHIAGTIVEGVRSQVKSFVAGAQASPSQ